MQGEKVWQEALLYETATPVRFWTSRTVNGSTASRGHRMITVLHCKHSRPCCAWSTCCPQSKSCLSGSRTDFQPSDGLWKRKLSYIQKPATLHWAAQSQSEEDSATLLDLPGWCSALPKQRKQTALLGTLQKLWPAPSYFSHSQDKRCQKQTKGDGVISHKTTLETARATTRAEPQSRLQAERLQSTDEKAAALPTRTQAGYKLCAPPAPRQPQKGPRAPALSTPWGQTYPARCVFAKISAGSETHLSEKSPFCSKAGCSSPNKQVLKTDAWPPRAPFFRVLLSSGLHCQASGTSALWPWSALAACDFTTQVASGFHFQRRSTCSTSL